MSGLSQDQIAWVSAFTNIDISAADPPPPSASPAGKPSGKPSAKGFFDRFKSGGGKGAQSPAATAAPPLPADKTLATKLTQLEDAIKAVEAKKFAVGRMRSDLADLKTQADKAGKETDDKKRTAALAAVGKRTDEQIKHVGALSKSIADVMGDKGEAPSDEKRSKVYEKAIKTFYKLDIEVPKGMKNTHLDRVFDMMGTVPVGDVKQDQLKHLVYNKADIGGVYYSDDYKDKDTKKKYKAGSIEMGNFGDATKTEPYKIDGKEVQANSFDVTTLHEIGHSVDQKHGIMDKHAKADGCGGWKSESVDTVAKAFLVALKASVALKAPVADAELLAAITAALGGTVTKPRTIAQPEWDLIQPFLVRRCVTRRDKSNPFFKPKPPDIDGRVYTQSGDDWFSYSSKARDATEVNPYQWRTPAEWFAEVYAITWLSKKKPPSAVPKDVAQHCWQG